MRKRYSPSFKAQVVLELLQGEKTVAQIASEQHVHPTQLNQWKALALKDLTKLFSDDHNNAHDQDQHNLLSAEMHDLMMTDRRWKVNRTPISVFFGSPLDVRPLGYAVNYLLDDVVAQCCNMRFWYYNPTEESFPKNPI